MGQSGRVQGPSQSDDPREIARWTRAYAQNRTLGLVVFYVIFLLLCAAIGGPSYVAGNAYRAGNMPLFVVCIALLVLAVAALIYFSVPWWGGQRMEQMVKCLYAKEGSVALATPHAAGRRRLGLAVGLGFAGCVLSSVILGLLDYIPLKYMQPVSALYLVPFLVILIVLMRPAVGWGALLWPALYALHAILIVAGAPILLTGRWQGLDVLISVAGYGLLVGLAGHAYSRFALRKLKRLARMGLSDSDGRPEVTER